MTEDTPLAILWRRKWIIIATFLAFVVTTAVVSKLLDEVYSTSSTLIISQPLEDQTFDAVQASQAAARSYADIIDSTNFAELVAAQLDGDLAARDLRDVTTVEPIVETQLLEITAEATDPEDAKEIADTYADVFIDYSRTRLSETTGADVTLATAAPLPEQPARPKPTLYVLLASVVGLALGIGLAFLRDRLDTRLRTSEDVEARFERPVLARIPRRSRSDTSVAAFGEAYRVLRTNLQFAAGGESARSIAVVSARESEGKTTTVAQLAIANAEMNRRVVVIEADLRRPALQRELEPDREEPFRPGLTNYLVEAASSYDAVHSMRRPNLSYVPAGPLPPSPSALLESRRARTVVPDFLQHADLAIIDCPPLSIGADASIISGWADAVLMVVDLERSTREAVRDALRQLDAVKAPVIGLVLNRDRRAEVARYDYYGTPPSATVNGKRSKRDAQRTKQPA